MKQINCLSVLKLIVLVMLRISNGLAAESRNEIEEVIITALYIDENAQTIAPHSVVNASNLLRKGGNLGENLNGLLGVHADTFGSGSSRPVIRGQGSPRVKVLSDSSSLIDASDISPDHAVTVDPLLSSSVEVLRGPATLLYGGGAIGGVVNVLDNKIAQTLPEHAVSGGVSLRGNTVADEKALATQLDWRLGQLVLHAENSWRDVQAYQVPALERGGTARGSIPGTFSTSRNSALGFSWVSDHSYLGVAFSKRDDDYGLPGHNHEYEACILAGRVLKCDVDHADHDDEQLDEEHNQFAGEDIPVVDLSSARWDLRAGIEHPLAGIHGIRLRASSTDYHHAEIDAGLVGTNFVSDGYEWRLEADHDELWGWHGIIGFHLASKVSDIVGEEAFMPRVKNRTRSLFAVEHRELTEHWHLELGARHERTKYTIHNTEIPLGNYSAILNSLSSALIWSNEGGYSVAFTVAGSQRAAQPQELYANGIHLATNTFELGAFFNENALEVESGINSELTFRKQRGKVSYGLNLFNNVIDNYIYAQTLDKFENFRLINYAQQSVRFRGAEYEISYLTEAGWNFTFYGDLVRGDFFDGSALPRISPQRLGLRVLGYLGQAVLSADLINVRSQKRLADYETVSPGYVLLNASVFWELEENSQFFISGTNLLDDEVWMHTSFLAAVVPQPGRNISVGLRLNF